MLLLVVIGVPVAFTIIMDTMEIFFEKMIWQRRVMKLAWDLCVLTLGLAAGLFADGEILHALNARGPYHPTGLLFASIVISFGVAVVLGLLRRQGADVKDPAGWKALLALVLGSSTLALPVYLVTLR
jgi:hypothetical protein